MFKIKAELSYFTLNFEAKTEQEAVELIKKLNSAKVEELYSEKTPELKVYTAYELDPEIQLVGFLNWNQNANEEVTENGDV